MVIDETYLLATILDTRFKKRNFSTSVVAETARSVLNAAVDDREAVRPTRPSEVPQPSTSTGIWLACQEIIEKAEMEEPISIFSGDSQTKNEIDAYLKLPNLSPTADPLVFWRENVHFPRLKKLAQNIFH
ncbi:unnamed protein product [Parnassius mnemosyne]|uniref:HAT C-terminal dimerisation domain-containing protein n=1 Tax=Parnassius mnemosyne TaxID=213953 RepID=A0AAV1LFC3_9NEOP